MIKLIPGDGSPRLPEPDKVNATIPDNQLPSRDNVLTRSSPTLQDTTQHRTEGQVAQFDHTHQPETHDQHQDKSENQNADAQNPVSNITFDHQPASAEEKPSVVKRVKDVMNGGFAKSKRPQLNTRDLTFWDSDLNSEDMDTTSISDLRKTKSKSSQSRYKKPNTTSRSEKRNSVGVASLRSSISGRSKPSAKVNDMEFDEKKDTDSNNATKQPTTTAAHTGVENLNETTAAQDETDDMSSQPPKKTTSKWGALRNTIRFQNQLQSNTRSHTDALREARRFRTGADVIVENLLNIQPAMIITMSMQRDEHKRPRIPVILSQLKIRITDSEEPLNRSRATFRIELEYGDGLMKWVIQRQYRDFLNLHYSYRRYDPTRTRIKGLPKFPKQSLPYFIGYRDDDDDDSSSDKDNGERDDDVAHRASRSEDNIALKHLAGNKRQDNHDNTQGRPNINHRNASLFSFRSNRHADHHAQQARFSAEQRKVLEKYLIDLTRCLMFRGEANRLCKFFEISALGIRLAADGGYQGKEGYMMVERRSDQMPSAHRSAFCGVHFKNIHKRLTPKWFLTRHSYIACVDEPHSVSSSVGWELTWTGAV
jgi:hypothetical protein